jgi:hypothetical protein
MDAAEQASAMAKELTRLNASTKGFRSQFVGTRYVLVQALPLYAHGATASRRRTIILLLEKIGLQADNVHTAYHRLIKYDTDERHQENLYERQQRTSTEHNNIIAHADKVLGEEEGTLQRQQQAGQVQGNIVAATVASMQAENGGNHVRPKKIDYHLKPKILGKEFTTSELRTWCCRMIFFLAAQLMETRDEEVYWANLYDCMHTSLKDYYKQGCRAASGSAIHTM